MPEKIRSIFTQQKTRLRQQGSAAKLTSVFMILISFTIVFFIFKDIFTYEFSHAYTADSPLYWTVGRGMLNGYKPYAEMYENKPIGIFLISAISFALTGGTILCNVVSCLAALMLTLIPAAVLLSVFKRTDETDGVRRTAAFLSVLLSGLLITVYSEVRSGGFQVEAIGAAFSVLFIALVVKLKNVQTRKKRIILTALASIALCCAAMIKEPFVIVSIFGALLFIDDLKQLIENLVIPCAFGGVLTLLLLTVGGVISPYFSIYISRMFETRVGGEGSSAFSRARDLLRVINDIKGFSDWLFYVILLFFGLTLLRGAIGKKQSAGRVFLHVIKVIAAVYAASFCVGMGGYYYNHHFIFAVPIYCAFVIYGGALLFEYKPKKGTARNIVILLLGVMMLITSVSIGNKYGGDYTEKYQSITAQAEYVDSLLDFYQEDRYQYIGFNGEDVFIGLTKHSPQGPVFAQDSDNFQTDDTWFAQKLKEQIDESNIVIVRNFTSPAVDDYIRNKLATEFTTDPSSKLLTNPPDGFNYTIYYRTSKYGQ